MRVEIIKDLKVSGLRHDAHNSVSLCVGVRAAFASVELSE